MRTKDELQGIVIGLQKAMQSPDGQLIMREIKTFRDAATDASFGSKTPDEAFKNLGVIRGLNIALTLDAILKQGLPK
jgi:hypothetical protein